MSERSVDTKKLAWLATEGRIMALKAINKAASGHPGGSLSCMDALVALYFGELNIRPDQPDWSERDRFVLSKGHSAPALYSVLALRGFFPKEDIMKLRSIDYHYSGHPDMRHVPGVDMSTGSLGQGFSNAVGLALAAKQLKKTWRTYAVLGDGEMDEGQVWEAMMAAAKYNLDNLCALIDNNGIQLDGRVDDIMPLYPLDEKLRAFRWNVLEADGHDFDSIFAALDAAKEEKGRPTAIILHTVKGKGVSFMEDTSAWHGKAPNAEQLGEALCELEERKAQLEKEVGANG